MNWGVQGFPRRAKPHIDQSEKKFNDLIPHSGYFEVWYEPKTCYTDDTKQTVCVNGDQIGYIEDKSGYNRHFYTGSGDVQYLADDNGFPAIYVKDGYLITQETFALGMQIVVFRSETIGWGSYNVTFSQYGSYTTCRQHLMTVNSQGGWHVAPSSPQIRNGVIQTPGASIGPITAPMVCAFGHRFPTTVESWVSGWDNGYNTKNMIIYEIIGLPILSNDKIIDIQEALMTKYNIS